MADETTEVVVDNDDVVVDDHDDNDDGDTDDDGEEPPEQPSYAELLADRDSWKSMAEAAGAGKAAAEAAKYRLKLREAEGERDDAVALADRLRDHTVRDVLDRAGLDHRLLELGKVTADQYLSEDGLIDADRLIASVKPLAADLGVAKPRRPQPNPLAGRASGTEPPNGKQVWDSAFGLGRR